MKDSAIILTGGMFNSRNAKTAFGLIRHSEKYRILAVIDQNYAEQDAGEGTDFHAIRMKKVSITPIQIDLTRHQSISTLSKWVEVL